jgi:Flp pilus assembly protein TadD/SAM-dependent methyltransferase
MLGVTHARLNNLEAAEESFRTVVSTDRNHPAAWENLGICLHLQGRLAEAEAALRESLLYQPNAPRALNNLGNLLRQAGRIEEAVDSYQRAIALQPGYAEAHNNLGNAYLDSQRTTDAIASYQRALSLRPGYGDTLHNLGSAWRLDGNSDRAVQYFREALRSNPANLEYARSLGTTLWDHGVDREARQILYHVLQARPTDVRSLPHRAVVTTLLEIPAVTTLAKLAIDGGYDAVKRMVSHGTSLAGLDNPVFLAALENIILVSPELEALLESVRRLFLESAVENPERDIGGISLAENGFATALAGQCFINEYVYFVSEAEEQSLQRIETQLARSAETGSRPDAATRAMLTAYAMYRPLNALPGPALIHAKFPESAPITKLIQQQISEPLEEQQILSTIESLTDVRDATSVAVAKHYDDNPYPRWVHLSLEKPRPHTMVLSRWLPPASNVQFSDERIQILIAGCGSGMHAFTTAAQYSDADVLAVDISKRCLAYAMRKAAGIKLGNIRFAHADLLEMRDVQESFHIIGASGVLQTLSDPVQGLQRLASYLKPGGLIGIGLYSKVARRNLIAASADFKARGFEASERDVRRLRKEILARPVEDPLRKTAVTLKDFYTLSECRNLFFLVQEINHEPEQIASMLDKAKLKFLGFRFPNRALGRQHENRYREMFPEDPDMTNLANWAEYERRYPDTFINMYDFWCQKAHAT